MSLPPRTLYPDGENWIKLSKTLCIRPFSKLAKFSANYHLANEWTCFVEHKFLHTSASLADLVYWLAHWPLDPEAGGSNPSKGGGNFLIFENYLCKLPIGDKFQLGITLLEPRSAGSSQIVFYF